MEVLKPKWMSLEGKGKEKVRGKKNQKSEMNIREWNYQLVKSFLAVNFSFFSS